MPRALQKPLCSIHTIQGQIYDICADPSFSMQLSSPLQKKLLDNSSSQKRKMALN
jgi:hypothetical protein